MIAVEGLRKSIRNGARTVDILRGLDFNVPKGEFVAIMGASGSGKSTLLGLLAGLDTPSAGEVRLNGVAISYLPEDRLAQVRGKAVGFVFQSYQLIPTLTALENVLLSYELNAEGDGLARARQLMASVGLGDRMDHYPVQLSGGEQQRVALARAFVMQPPIVLADEPTGNLDTTNGALVLKLLLELNRKEGTTLVLVTHDATLAECADRRIVLRDGAIISDDGNISQPRPERQTPFGRLDGERAGMGNGGEDRGAGDAAHAREVSICNSFGCNWSSSTDRGAGIFGVVPRDAAGPRAVDHGGGPCGEDE